MTPDLHDLPELPRDEVLPGEDLSIEEASVELGMSPTAVIALLESGRLPAHLGPDGRRRRILRSDLDLHREDRFTVRQELVQAQRARRWADDATNHPELPGLG